MMQNYLLIFCTVVFVISYVIENRKINPITLFFGEWMIMIFLNSLGLFSLSKTDNETYMIMFVGCVAFLVGSLLKLIFPTTIRIKNKTHRAYSNNINKRIIYTLSIFTIIFLVIDGMNSYVSLLRGMSFAEIRQMAQSGAQFSNRIMNAIRIIIVSPFSMAIMPIAAMEILNEKRDKRVLGFAIIITALRTFSDGGRSAFFYFAMSLAIGYTYHRKSGKARFNISNRFNGKLRITRKKFMALFIAAGLGYLFWKMTLARNGAGRMISFSYYYFAMQPIMLEKWISRVNSANLVGYGMASFNGFLFPFFYLIFNFFQVGYPSYWRSLYDMIEAVGTDWQTITVGGLTANSYVSVFWYLYLDGRLFGVIIGMALLGYIMSALYERVIKEQTTRLMAAYSLLMVGLFYSFQYIVFSNMSNALGLLIIFLAYKRVRPDSIEKIKNIR